MDLFEIGGIDSSICFSDFHFHPLHSLHWARLLPCTFVNLFKLCYHLATITNPWIWTICGTLIKGVSFGLSFFLLGLLGTLENFIENTFGVYVSMSLGDHGNEINGQDVWPPKKGACSYFAPWIHSYYWKDNIGSHKSMMDTSSCKNSLEL